jgi:hypothetical protein
LRIGKWRIVSREKREKRKEIEECGLLSEDWRRATA